jgi:hypothetical protein
MFHFWELEWGIKTSTLWNFHVIPIFLLIGKIRIINFFSSNKLLNGEVFLEIEYFVENSLFIEKKKPKSYKIGEGVTTFLFTNYNFHIFSK